MSVSGETPVGQLVAERIQRAAVLDRHGIDYCCGGKASLERACKVRGVALQEVIHELQAVENDTAACKEDDMVLPLGALADRIVETHHAYLREALPRLEEKLVRVVEAHGERHPELTRMREVFGALKAELELHMMKEERILFPLIKELEAAVCLPAIHCGTVDNPIRVMEHEHDSAGNALKELHALSGGFTAPADACTTYRVLFHGLQELESDLHRHIHRENNILFPKASAMERSLRERAV